MEGRCTAILAVIGIAFTKLLLPLLPDKQASDIIIFLRITVACLVGFYVLSECVIGYRHFSALKRKSL